MIQRKTTGILLIIFSILAIALIIYVLFFYKFGNKAQNTAGNETGTGEQQEVLPESKLNTNVTSSNQDTGDTPNLATTDNDRYEVSVGTTAKNFAERYGTWSNQSSDDYLTGLRLITTSKMFTWLESQDKSKAAARGDYKQYEATITQVLNVDASKVDEAKGVATVIADIKYTEEKQGAESKISNRKMKIDLIRSGKSWKVDAAVWQ